MGVGRSQSQEGRSVATMWAEMVQAAVNGEVVGITDKWGNDVAVMVNITAWEDLQQRLVELEQRVGEIE